MDVTKTIFPLEDVVGRKALLVSVSDVNEYREGKRTGNVIGTKYNVLLLEKKYTPLSVKVMDKPIITSIVLEECEEPPIVSFNGITGKIYLDKTGKIQMSVTAESIVEIS